GAPGAPGAGDAAGAAGEPGGGVGGAGGGVGDGDGAGVSAGCGVAQFPPLAGSYEFVSIELSPSWCGPAATKSLDRFSGGVLFTSGHPTLPLGSSALPWGAC